MEDNKQPIQLETVRNLRRFFNKQGHLTVWPPAKERDKILILSHLITHFEVGKTYTVQELNAILLPLLAASDPGTIRSALYEYHFVQRARDGSHYWRIEQEHSQEERIQKRQEQVDSYV